MNIAKFVMCKCTTIRVNGTFQFTFCLVMRLNSTIITCCDSLIVILVHWTDETRQNVAEIIYGFVKLVMSFLLFTRKADLTLS